MATTAPPTPDYVMGLMRGVIDPELGSDIVELGMAKGATVTDDGWIRLQIDLTTSGCPLRAQIQKDIRARLTSLPGVTRVTIDWGELTQDERAEILRALRCVDKVFFEESLEQKAEYIRDYSADVLVMGDDWEGKFDDLSSLCEIIYLARTPAISTTEVIEKIRL